MRRHAAGGLPPLHGDIQVDVGGVMGNNANEAGRYNGLNTTASSTASANFTWRPLRLGLRRHAVL
jgi:hypothetical protein